MYPWIFVVLLFEFQLVLSQSLNERNVILESCINGKYHKTDPGPEDEMHSKCVPWKNKACCTTNTSDTIDVGGQMYNLNFNHCGQNMSEECRKHFLYDLCFYECEPHLGPWVVKVNQTYRKERVMYVPLCSDDCDTWFEACKNDLTCADNWIKGLKSVNGIAQCRDGQTCTTVEKKFGNARNFCEKVWDNSWQYTSSDKPCMRMWFDNSGGNPNERVAKLRIAEIQAEMWGAAAGSLSQTVVAMILTMIVTLFVCH